MRAVALNQSPLPSGEVFQPRKVPPKISGSSGAPLNTLPIFVFLLSALPVPPLRSNVTVTLEMLSL